MNCDEVRPILLDYVMEEAPAADRAAIQRHLETCAACSEEAGKCRQTLATLAQGAAFEETPQRIRLVREPANWWAAFWLNPARLAFAGAGLACIALALLALARTTVSYQQGSFAIAFGGPAVSTARTPLAVAASAPAPTTSQGLTREEVARLIAEAVASSEARKSGETARIVNAAAQQSEQRRTVDRLEIAESLRYFQATQVNMWKQQVENQQVVAALQRQSGDPLPQR